MTAAILLSGGSGTRLGTDIPKQYIEIKGKPVFMYSLETLGKSEKIDVIYIVAKESWQQYILDKIEKRDKESNDICLAKKFKGFVEPGDTRQLSIFNGLKFLEGKLSENDYVLVHDAARPFVSADDIDCLCNEASAHDGALPVIPMKDTIYISQDGKSVSSLIDRNTLFAGQAPEIFLFGKYLNANRELIIYEDDNGSIKDTSPIYNIKGSTEPAIKAGMDIVMIPGNEDNFKITTEKDLECFKRKVECLE